MTKLVFNAETLAKSINSENGNEIVFEEYFDIQKSEGENSKDPKFEYFKKRFLTIWQNWRRKKITPLQRQSTLTSGFRKQISRSGL